MGPVDGVAHVPRSTPRRMRRCGRDGRAPRGRKDTSVLTARGWWFLTLSAFLTLVGVVGVAWWSAIVPILGLSLLAWFLVEWAVFAYRFRSSADRLAVDRVLLQAGRSVPAVWAGTRFTVRVAVTP